MPANLGTFGSPFRGKPGRTVRKVPLKDSRRVTLWATKKLSVLPMLGLLAMPTSCLQMTPVCVLVVTPEWKLVAGLLTALMQVVDYGMFVEPANGVLVLHSRSATRELPLVLPTV